MNAALNCLNVELGGNNQFYVIVAEVVEGYGEVVGMMMCLNPLNDKEANNPGFWRKAGNGKFWFPKIVKMPALNKVKYYPSWGGDLP